MSAPVAIKPFRVLIVDDDPALCQGLSAMIDLHLRQTVVRTALSIRDALHEVTAAAYDLVLCDLMMGDGSGADLASRIRVIRPETIVLLMTAHPKPEIYQNLAGAFGYIKKPFDRGVLLDTLRRLMRFSRLRKQLESRGRSVEDRVRLIQSFQMRLGMQLHRAHALIPERGARRREPATETPRRGADRLPRAVK